MRLLRSLSIVLLSFIVVILLMGTLVTAAEIKVPEDYSTISAATSSAAPGDTVLVGPGTYEENIEVIVPGLSIQSTDGPAVTIIRGEIRILASGLRVSKEGEVSIKDVTISGFTITCLGNGIVVKNAFDATIKNNTISGNHKDGILLTGDCSNILIEGNQIGDNWDAGIDLLCSGNNYTIRDNNISDNWIGIRIGEDAGGVLIEDNVIEDNQYANIHPM